jgi:signal transduction histidine kinase/CheY-like chemotaxis protein
MVNRLQDPNIRAVVSNYRDVTARKRAEEGFRLYADIFRNIRLGINVWRLDEDGETLRLVASNAAATLMTGISFADAVGKRMDELLPEHHRSAIPDCYREVIRTGVEKEVGEVRFEDERLRDKAFSVKAFPLPGRCVGVSFENISERMKAEEERRRLEEQLVQSQKMEAVGRLAGGIAHDFNNLLTAIAGYSELLLGQLSDGDPRLAHAAEIRKAGERAAALTQQLLAFSRRQVLEPRVLDLNQVVAGMEDMLRRLIGEDVELRIRAHSGLWPVKADPGQIEQAILNLVVNARDAMPEGGKLSLETANVELDETYAGTHVPVEPGGYAMLAVTDSGVGMGDEVKARLFEPFFTTKGRGKGTGLGLSTTYGIVKQSGGYIWCYSEPGHGTVFKIYLPRVDAPVERPAAGPMPAVSGSAGETVLLVEDEREVRALVQKLLRMQGYTLLTAANPDEAVSMSREYRGTIHLMVTDVVMPGMSGRQLAERLAASRPGMKVLYVSGYTDDAIVHHGILEPGTAFLQKPFSPQALARKVREVLEAPPPPPATEKS